VQMSVAFIRCGKFDRVPHAPDGVMDPFANAKEIVKKLGTSPMSEEDRKIYAMEVRFAIEFCCPLVGWATEAIKLPTDWYVKSNLAADLGLLKLLLVFMEDVVTNNDQKCVDANIEALKGLVPVFVDKSQILQDAIIDGVANPTEIQKILRESVNVDAKIGEAVLEEYAKNVHRVRILRTVAIIENVCEAIEENAEDNKKIQNLLFSSFAEILRGIGMFPDFGPGSRINMQHMGETEPKFIPNAASKPHVVAENAAKFFANEAIPPAQKIAKFNDLTSIFAKKSIIFVGHNSSLGPIYRFNIETILNILGIRRNMVNSNFDGNCFVNSAFSQVNFANPNAPVTPEYMDDVYKADGQFIDIGTERNMYHRKSFHDFFTNAYCNSDGSLEQKNIQGKKPVCAADYSRALAYKDDKEMVSDTHAKYFAEFTEKPIFMVCSQCCDSKNFTFQISIPGLPQKLSGPVEFGVEVNFDGPTPRINMKITDVHSEKEKQNIKDAFLNLQRSKYIPNGDVGAIIDEFLNLNKLRVAQNEGRDEALNQRIRNNDRDVSNLFMQIANDPRTVGLLMLPNFLLDPDVAAGSPSFGALLHDDLMPSALKKQQRLG
jgi:hypothetical protein